MSSSICSPGLSVMEVSMSRLVAEVTSLCSLQPGANTGTTFSSLQVWCGVDLYHLVW